MISQTQIILKKKRLVKISRFSELGKTRTPLEQRHVAFENLLESKSCIKKVMFFSQVVQTNYIYTGYLTNLLFIYIYHMASPLKLKAQIIMNSNIQSSDRVVGSVYREYKIILTEKEEERI